MKRLNEDGIQDSSYDSSSKKIKTINDDDILEKFTCDYYYIDKSLLIEKFLKNKSKIICFTAPSGYGKTTNLKMMRYFFEMNYQNEENPNNRELFKKLEIANVFKDGKSYVDLYQGKYPVVYIDFNLFNIGDNLDETRESFKIFIQYIYNTFKYNIRIKDLTDYQQIVWKNFINYDFEKNLNYSLSFLCFSISELLNKQIILLIDNYDAPFLKALNIDFYNNVYSFIKQLLTDVFYKNQINEFLFKSFVTGKINIPLFKDFKSKNYSLLDYEYKIYYSILDCELRQLLSQFKISNQYKVFEKCCNNNICTSSNCTSSNFNTINISDTKRINIFTSSSASNRKNNDEIDPINNNNNNNIIKCYDLLSVNEYLQKELSNSNYDKKSLPFHLMNDEFFNEAFEIFDYNMINDIDYLLQNGSIEKSIPKLTNFEMLKKEYINSHREIIWTLLIEYGYLNCITIENRDNKKLLTIRNEQIKKYIEENISAWKRRLYQKYQNIIKLFINKYDEEKTEVYLENLVNKNYGFQYGFLDNYYTLIYTLLSLNYEFGYKVITKNNIKEKENIRELLYVSKDDENIANNNSISNNKNIKYNSEVLYITIKEEKNMEKGCIEALEDNEDFEFNGIKLKEKYDKIIKFGIAVCEYKCKVIYEFNYGNNFKRQEMPKITYEGEKFNELFKNEHFFIDKTRMISRLIEKKRGVFLITRPRRFGKSLNLMMIKEFFEKYYEKNNTSKNIVEKYYNNQDDTKKNPSEQVDNDKSNTRNNSFDGLEVSKNRINMREFHKYPVIYLNLKSDDSKNYEAAIKSLKSEIADLFKYQKKFIQFEELEESDKQKWNAIENKIEDEKTFRDSLKFLCYCLKKFYKRESIILIDEYDSVLLNGFMYNYYYQIRSDIYSLFSTALKGNEYLKFGITTGCLDIGLKSLFSGVNNTTLCSFVSDSYFGDCYGFTEKEVNKILSHFGFCNISEKVKDEIKKEYDGYSCYSEAAIYKNIYNPFSIISFVNNNKTKKSDFKCKNYWVNSGNDYILKVIISNNEFSFEKDFLNLLYGNVIIVDILNNISFDKLNYENILNENINKYKNEYSKVYIWTVMLYSGYITLADEDEYKKNVEEMDDQITKLISLESEENINEEENINDEENINENELNKNTIIQYKNEIINKNCEVDKKYVKVPNKEVMKELINILKSNIKSELKIDDNDKYMENFINGIFAKNINIINENIKSYLLKFSSYHLFTKANTYENCYQVLLMQMFIFLKVEGLTAEENSGKGRYDFGFPNKYNKKEYIIIEVKVPNKNKTKNNKIDLDKECKNAIKQIEDKKYAQKHIDNGYTKILKYGIAFFKRNCKVLLKIDNKIISPS